MRLIGHISETLTPYISIQLPVGKELELVVDTGFNGYLVIPHKFLDYLNLSKLGSTVAMLADGSEIESEVYEGDMIWFGSAFRVFVHATKSNTALLGMRMLLGSKLLIDVDHNAVVIEQH